MWTIIIIIIIIIISIFIFLNYRTKLIEPMVVTSDNMKKNVYNKYGIILDEDNNKLRYKDKVIDYTNNFNSNEGIKKSNCKITTSNILSKNGYPVCNYISWNNNISDNDNIQNINNKLKFPLVVKYSYGEKGTDVYTDVNNNNKLLEVINKFINENKKHIIIEEQAIGNKYRIMILNDKFVYADEDDKPIITGNGVSTIDTLIKEFPNKNKTKPIKMINEDLIEQQGYKINDILEKGKKIEVTNIISISNGGKQKYIDENKIHPLNIDLFKKINNIMGLNFSGIDYISKSLSIPYTVEGKIIEVNPYPGFSVTEQKNTGVVKNWINAIFGI